MATERFRDSGRTGVFGAHGGAATFGRLAVVAALAVVVWFGSSGFNAWWNPVWSWLQRVWPLMAAGVLLLVGVPALRGRSPRRADDMRTLSSRSILFGAVVVLGLGVTAAGLLLKTFGGGTPSERLDAIRTAGSIVVGTGGAVALLLAARRQRSTELTLAHQRQVAATSEYDANERRITELYTKAADQLGAEKAAVRLAGLYALERLGESAPAQRQTIGNVVCAYLRMPYEPVAPSENATDDERQRRREAVEEQQVRRAALDILARRADQGTDGYWDSLRIDLTGAALADALLAGAHLGGANLSGANLTGANLVEAKLAGAVLDDAVLVGADLTEANLTGASLRNADLTRAWLSGARMMQADLHGARLVRACLDEAAMYGANLREADARSARLRWVNLRHTKLEKASFVDAFLERADLNYADGPGADFTSAFLGRARLVGASLVKAKFTDATLTGAHFGTANLEGADFTGTFVKDANFKDANLDEAVLPDE
ncbi:pentapeptide repeat-containing protein [Lentzea sp. NPDC004782]|uniref:pentapeptide repeat-containing protein n=1 Tax=Lentzea sp. NPDC004782 TaxID=3154458 RepID=UPI0033BBDE65